MPENAKKPQIRFKGFTDAWEQRKFGESVLIERGGSPRPIDEYITDDSRGLNWIKIGDAPEQGNYITKTAEKIKTTGLSKTRQVVPGDLILSNSMSFGRPYIMAIEGCIHDGWLLIRNIRDEFDLIFLCYLLGIPQMIKQYKSMAAGSTVNNLNKELVGNTIVKIPPKDEQIHLGKFFNNLDNLITLHQRKLDKLKNIKKSMLEKMFPKNGSNVPEIRFTGFTDAWEQRKFYEIFEERHIISTISEEYPQLSFTISDGVIFPEDRKTNKRDFLIIDKATKKYLVTEYNDIIYNPANVIYGAIHRNSLRKGCVSPIYKIFFTKQNSKFMECIVRNENFINSISKSLEGTVTKLKTLKPESFLKMSSYISPIFNEQEKIGEFFSNIDNLITLHQRKLEKLQNIKKACLEKMFV